MNVIKPVNEFISSDCIARKKTSRWVRGFTLLEILIVVSITIMISALAISYKSSTQQQVGLYVEVQKLAGLILRAKSLAVATYNDPEAFSDPSSIICGYGVSIDYLRNGYDLFSYKIPAGESCENITEIQNSGSSPPDEIVVLSSHSVAPGVIILDNFPNDSIYKVFFVPPAPITLIGTESPVGAVGRAPGRIYLITKDSSVTGEISVSA